MRPHREPIFSRAVSGAPAAAYLVSLSRPCSRVYSLRFPLRSHQPRSLLKGGAQVLFPFIASNIIKTNRWIVKRKMSCLLRSKAEHAGQIAEVLTVFHFVENVAIEIQGRGAAAVQVQGVFAAQGFHALGDPVHGCAVAVLGAALDAEDHIMAGLDTAHGHAGISIQVALVGFVIQIGIDHAVPDQDGAKGKGIDDAHIQVFPGGVFVALKNLHAAIIEQRQDLQIGPFFAAGGLGLLGLDLAVADNDALLQALAAVIPAIAVKIVADGENRVILIGDFQGGQVIVPAAGCPGPGRPEAENQACNGSPSQTR